VSARRCRLRDALRLLPDVIRLVNRLAGDHSLPRGVRVRPLLLLAYLALPIDLVPDYIPVLGYADDAIAILLALRSVARSAYWNAIGPGLRAAWPPSAGWWGPDNAERPLSLALQQRVPLTAPRPAL
jgi:uncharacterized membrane protein YkvA (DUF1232 family)